METEPFVRKAQYYETDQMGIIHHSNYIRWFEEARLDYLDKHGISYRRIEELGIVIPVLEVECKYKHMVHFGDEVRIYTTVKEYTGTRLTLGYEVLDAADQLMTLGSSKHCFLSGDTGRLVSLKRSFPAVHELFEKM